MAARREGVIRGGPGGGSVLEKLGCGDERRLIVLGAKASFNSRRPGGGSVRSKNWDVGDERRLIVLGALREALTASGRS
jgi:hypothetical protein